jgi:hypothetical protein
MKGDHESIHCRFAIQMKDVLKALNRNEKVTILYHGKVQGTIVPKVMASARKVTDHEFFGMRATQPASVEAAMEQLREGRYSAL